MAEKTQTFHVERPFTLYQDHYDSLSLLYLPLIGSLAFSLYHMLAHLSDPTHQKSVTYPQSYLADALAQAPGVIKEARETLEAAALLRTYQDQTHLTLVLVAPVLVSTFKKSALQPYLQASISHERWLDLKDRLRVHTAVKPQGQNISKRFDERFKPLQSKPEHHDLKVASPIDVTPVLEAIPITILPEKDRDKGLLECCQHIAFLYDLSERQLSEVLLETLAQKKPLDALTLSETAHKFLKPKPHTRAYRNDVTYLQAAHPKQVINDLTGTSLSAGDARIVERLLLEVNWPLELINMLLVYVLYELDMQMPAFGYFEKVVAQWNRKKIRSASEALEHIKAQKAKREAPKKAPSPRRKSKQSLDVEVDWFKDYLKQQEGESE